MLSYIQHFPSGKRKMYARLLRENQRNSNMIKIRNQIVANLKKDEFVVCADNKVRPRVI